MPNLKTHCAISRIFSINEEITKNIFEEEK